MAKATVDDIIHLILAGDLESYFARHTHGYAEENNEPVIMGNVLSSKELNRLADSVKEQKGQAEEVRQLMHKFQRQDQERYGYHWTDEDIGKVTETSGGQISQLKSGKTIGSKQTLIKVAIFFELTHEETERLFAASGKAFNLNDLFECCIRACLIEKKYEIEEINEVIKHVLSEDETLVMKEKFNYLGKKRGVKLRRKIR